MGFSLFLHNDEGKIGLQDQSQFMSVQFAFVGSVCPPFLRIRLTIVGKGPQTFQLVGCVTLGLGLCSMVFGVDHVIVQLILNPNYPDFSVSFT